MRGAIIITPVKNSIDTAKKSIAAVRACAPENSYYVYNDNSDVPATETLERLSETLKFKLIHLSDITSKPSPNYDIVLREAQKKALEQDKHLIIVESDVVIRPETIPSLLEFANQKEKLAMVAAITVDESGEINYPFVPFKDVPEKIIPTRKIMSFSCTLITNEFMKNYSFADLDHSQDWFDTIISEDAIKMGFSNIILKDVSVIHYPHSSRPWKYLKYKNPLKYYFIKIFKGKKSLQSGASPSTT
ncbi:MAG: glycosyltransferase [Chitinophagaceae bacterium]|nr:glycosyltransferase [Chitinophagaceae bacterium]